MALRYRPDLIPKTRRGAEVLLESADWNLSSLTAAQTAAIRGLYWLDDDRSLEQLVRDGEITP